MTRRASPKTLLKRRIKDGDFPIIIRRKIWADWLTGIFAPIFFAIGAGLIWILTGSDISLGWGALFLGAMAFAMFLAAYVGIDNIGYRVEIDANGLTLIGLLQTFRLHWSEISHFGLWRGRAVTDDGVFFLGFYQARIFVDGTNNPSRMPRNLWFKGYFVPPMMEAGGKELVSLMRKAGRHWGHDLPDHIRWEWPFNKANK